MVIGAPVAPGPLVELLWWVSRRYICPPGRVFDRAVPPRVRVKPRTLPDTLDAIPSDALAGYEGADELMAAIVTRSSGTYLLQLVPGADRAAVIAQLVGAARDGVIVTVPEVRYGSSVIDGLSERWPVARVDAGVDDPTRSRGWIEAAYGAPLVAGGRSAVFAPVPNLHLVVVDEEHHPTYKEDRAPRYDARVVARERARLSGAMCVLISQCPSVESAHAALQGTYGSVRPSSQMLRAARPIVELAPSPQDRSLSHELHDRMRTVLRAGGRVGLLAPARGFARAVWCASCRRSLRCGRCEAGLAYDRSMRGLRCPRCTWMGPAPDVCPHCGASDFRFIGAGSERLAEQVAAAFPREKVVRVDPDVLATTGRPAEDASIYLTTWVGAKEALRPPVDLVGVLQIDPLIRRPDLRAAERAHRVLAEMAEWAGPASGGGHLLVQSDEPAHHVVQAVVRGDPTFFSSREIEQRRELGYPPFSELVKVTATGPHGKRLIDAACVAARAVGARVLGPIEVPTSPLGEDALEALIKCSDAGVVADALQPIAADVPAGNRLRVDVDPR